MKHGQNHQPHEGWSSLWENGDDRLFLQYSGSTAIFWREVSPGWEKSDPTKDEKGG